VTQIASPTFQASFSKENIMTFEQKHSPTKFNQLVFEDDAVRDRLSEYASNKRHRNLLLVGEYGVAKSKTAQLIAEAKVAGLIPAQAIDILNAADITNMPAELSRIEAGWRFHQMCGVMKPVAIIDELHLLQPVTHQYRLRAFMDRRADGMLIFTANNLQAIDKGIQNRCDVVEIAQLSAHTIANRCANILRSEGVRMPRKKLLQLLETCDGTWRDALRALEDRVLSP
jgi:DNA polymerase III delta prime subunit